MYTRDADNLQICCKLLAFCQSSILELFVVNYWPSANPWILQICCKLLAFCQSLNFANLLQIIGLLPILEFAPFVAKYWPSANYWCCDFCCKILAFCQLLMLQLLLQNIGLLLILDAATFCCKILAFFASIVSLCQQKTIL